MVGRKNLMASHPSPGEGDESAGRCGCGVSPRPEDTGAISRSVLLVGVDVARTSELIRLGVLSIPRPDDARRRQVTFKEFMAVLIDRQVLVDREAHSAFRKSRVEPNVNSMD